MTKMVIHLPGVVAEYEGDIRYFVDSMVKKLAVNSDKGWVTKHDVRAVRDRIQVELNELDAALQNEGQFEALMETVDVANLSLLCGMAITKQTRREFDAAKGPKQEVRHVGSTKELKPDRVPTFRPRVELGGDLGTNSMDWPALRRLSFVPRWTIVPTVYKQNVAEHTFHVLWIYLWLHNRFAVSKNDFYALCRIIEHDADEAMTGDGPSPSKPFPDASDADAERCWIKIADYLEAYLFIREDAALGNSTMNAICIDVCNRGQVFVERLRAFGWGVPDFTKLASDLWGEVDVKKHPGMRGDMG